MHMLLIFDIDDKLREPEEYDRVVRAEIPKKGYTRVESNFNIAEL